MLFNFSGSHSGLLLARRRDEGVHGIVRQAGQVLGLGDQPGAAGGRARRPRQVGAVGEGAQLHGAHDRVVGQDAQGTDGSISQVCLTPIMANNGHREIGLVLAGR